jgi:serine/threonine protein kinase
MGPTLGQGAYATVKQATHKQSNMIVAIKIYDKFKLSSNQQVKKSVSREIRLLALLSNTARKDANEKKAKEEETGIVSMVFDNPEIL